MSANLMYAPPARLPSLTLDPRAEPVVRQARVGDVPRLYEMINVFAARGDMLPKTMDQLYNRVRDFRVAEIDGEVVGCAALKVTWADLAEIVSVAVHPDAQGRRIGTQLVLPLFDEARALGIPTLFVLTLKVSFFQRLGFREVPRLRLSHKVWQDCTSCFKQDRCDEVAMVRQI